MTCCFSRVIREHLSVLLANGNEKLVDRHGGIDGDFATEEGLHFMLLNGGRSMFREQRSQAFDTHGGVLEQVRVNHGTRLVTFTITSVTTIKQVI
jgi:hypothetical protein